MRFFVLFVAAVVAIIGLSFFRPESVDEKPNELKISVYVTDPEDSTRNRLTRLNVGETLYCSLDTNGIYNINVFFDFDGVVDVSSEDAQLSVGNDEGVFYDNEKGMKDRRFGYRFHINDDGYMTFRPVGSYGGYIELDEKMGLLGRVIHEVGHEYYAYINAYADELNDSPTVTATLKFVKVNSEYGQFTVELIEN